MSLSPSQRNTLKTAMLAIPELAAAITAGDTVTLLAWSNADAVPAVSAWRDDITSDEVYAAHKPKEFQARSAGERDGFMMMCAREMPHDFTVAKVRNGVAAIFSGNTNSSGRLDIFAAAQQPASNTEVVLGGSNVSVGGSADMAETVTAFKRNWVGDVEQGDIDLIVAQVQQAQGG